jgi:YnfA/UPF0060 family uncharacterized protein
MTFNDLTRSILLFVLAGLMEIGGGYLMWLWLRERWARVMRPSCDRRRHRREVSSDVQKDPREPALFGRLVRQDLQDFSGLIF